VGLPARGVAEMVPIEHETSERVVRTLWGGVVRMTTTTPSPPPGRRTSTMKVVEALR
jgi:hypothetical protein